MVYIHIGYAGICRFIAVNQPKKACAVVAAAVARVTIILLVK